MKQLDKENLVDNIKIKYLDNHILVAIKDANILTQPNESNQISLEDLLKDYIKKKYEKTGNVFLHAVHRLDKEVYGLVLFARTSKALSRLNEQMRDKKIKKKYIAEVEGKLSIKKGKLTNVIIHSSHIAKIVSKSNKDAKEAILFYEVIEEKKDTSILEIDLITGRYHQIRAQLSNLGHPIVGDQKYQSKMKSDKIHLCCSFLEFMHPVKNEKIQIEIKPNF